MVHVASSHNHTNVVIELLKNGANCKVTRQTEGSVSTIGFQTFVDENISQYILLENLFFKKSFLLYLNFC